MSITVSMSEMMKKGMEEIVKETIRSCAARYNFDEEEAMRMMKVEVKEGKKEIKKEEKIEEIPIPFVCVKERNCEGVKQNHNLFTQCENAKGENDIYCSGCRKEAKKNESGEPNCGRIKERAEKGGEYKDPKGRKVVEYVKVMRKLNLTKEKVLEEAKRKNIEIDESIFENKESKRGRPKKEADENSKTFLEKKGRGRPKKESKMIEVDGTEDLFKTLMSEAKESLNKKEEEMSDMSESEDEKSVVLDKEEKAKEGKKAEKDAAKEAKKTEKDAAKEAKKAEKKAEKEAKKGGKKEEKKEEKKKETKKEEKNKTVTVEDSDEEDADEESTTVKEFVHEGKKYLRSLNNIIYDIKSHDPIGMWNTETKTIDECELEEEEEE